MNTDTKRHIDAARQVLVGVVPNPTSQIDQITNALIYKFMDDMDQAAIKAGGDPSFFVGDLEQYAWTRLMDPRMGNQERMNLYSEVLLKFSEAKQLPELFRGIFKSAFLPYRSPEVLGLFLKEISYFDYSHSEELGNAYEYLLSIMSSQGDAGQFRTPRHIIDFIVDVVNPTKDDKVLDPACGTAGFLISAYKHILEQHDGKEDPHNNEKQLTPDERKLLMNNFEGYDIDPGMVRIAQVNMYLHQFKNPKIFQYDSLSSDERWGDKFDVILANPPFMSPKGGIKPHSKFGILSSRSEVLFVDYIINHLRPTGRAGIIVPEGIIFQSGTAYKQLRKSLVEDGLFCVVSLPSGVFAPYSGVKTSILLFDNELAKQKNVLLFVDIKDTGVSLGATQRMIEKNDLVPALKLIKEFQIGKNLDPNKLAFVTAKQEIIDSHYDLSAAKFRKHIDVGSEKPFGHLSDVCTITKGKSSSTKTEIGPYPLLLTAENTKLSDHFDFDGEGVCVPLISATGHGKAAMKRVHYTKGKFALANLLAYVEPKSARELSPKYLYHILDSAKAEMAKLMNGAANVSMKTGDLGSFQIPLPHPGIQEQIVAELDGYQNIVNGAKQIVANWNPKIDIDPEWEKVKLGSICERFTDGSHFSPESIEDGLPYITVRDIDENGKINLSDSKRISKVSYDELVRNGCKPKKGDVLFSKDGTVGKVAIVDFDDDFVVLSSLAILSLKEQLANPKYIYYTLQVPEIVSNAIGMMKGVAIKRVILKDLKSLIVPLPTLEIQKQIVEKIEAESVLVESSKKLIEIYEQKTKDSIAKLWGNNDDDN